MKELQLVWHTDSTGKLRTETSRHSVSVERLLPAESAKFVLRDANGGLPLASGTRASATEAMAVAEQIVARLMEREAAMAA